MKAEVYNLKEEKVGTIDLPAKVFAQKWNPDLVHQAVLAQLGNSREPVAHAKGRGEVSGGGKKPWKQKGTGRARHGSNRSPIWIGGGVTFGPLKEKDYSKKLNKKMKTTALFAVLSKKLVDNEVKFIESFFENDVKELRKRSGVKKFATTLLIPTVANKKAKLIVSNAEKLNAISPKSLNVYDLLKFKNIFIEKDAVAEIENNFSAKAAGLRVKAVSEK